ncbi:CBS domain-containing protein [Lapillicoccus sp.]|uniref:CBS domain-containing protein n=1 Tax=Lapillicoccus sp. TaxID=1909287 RepID=UPI0025D4DD1A|nr:CBS domain-containing protein [Lapillicoccus sp.]
MSSPAVTVPHRAALDVAIQMLARGGYTTLPVVDERGELVGIVSEADLLKTALPPDPRAHMRPPATDAMRQPTSVADVMTPDPHTTTQSSDVADVAEIFARTSWKSLPVVRGREPVGVISRSDVIRVMARGDVDLAIEVNAALHEMGGMAAHASVEHGIVEISGTGTAHQGAAAVAVASTVLGVRRVQLAHDADLAPTEPSL